MGLNDSEGSVPSLACRGLGMQRSVKSQALTLHRGPIVLHSQSIANPHKARAFCCLCRFHPAVDVAGFSTSALVCFFFFSTFFYSCASFCFPTTFAERLFFPCHSAASVFSLSTQPDPSLQTPVGCESRHIKASFDRTKARKRGNSGQLVLLSGTPACHAFNSLSRCLFPL